MTGSEEQGGSSSSEATVEINGQEVVKVTADGGKKLSIF
jgi:hypothetical protein